MIKVEVIEENASYDFERHLDRFLSNEEITRSTILNIDVGTRGRDNEWYYAVIVYDSIITQSYVDYMVKTAREEARDEFLRIQEMKDKRNNQES